MTSFDWNDNALFHTLFDNLSDAVFLFEWTEQGEPGRCVEVNLRASQWLGYARAELLTLDCAALHPPERSAEYQRLFRALATEGHLLIPTELVSQTSQRIPVEIHACLSTWNNRPVVICVARDLTPRRQTQAELQQRMELEQLIADVSVRFSGPAPESFETTVRSALQTIGKFIAADRFYLTILVEGTHIIESSLDWCAPGIASAGTRYNGIAIDRFAWTLAHFTRHEAIRVDDVSALPTEAAQEKEIWSQTNIQSLVAIPIFLEGVLAGYLGFNIEHQPVEKKWSETEFRLLRVMADLFAGALARKRYEERRASLGRDLERKVAERTAQLQESETKARALAHQIIHAQEEERHHLARELHDDVGQTLNVFKIRLALLRNELTGETHKQARGAIEDALELVDQTLQSIHTLAQGLRPAGLDTVGLHLSLEGLCREFARQTRLPIDYRGEPVTGLEDAATIALYRFLQEALTNVAKHARAHRVWVTLERNGHYTSLAVRDDGQGFDVAAVSSTPDRLGWLNMRERFETLGGDLAIESRVGHGTCLTARVPMEPDQ